VHACDFYANVFALTGAALARVPLRLGSRRDILIPQRSAGQHRLQSYSYRFAHRVVANSRAAAEQLLREGVSPNAISVIPNGIDRRLYARARSRTPRRTVTTVANLRAEKGHDVLIRAAARVTRDIPGAVFQLVGDGPMRDALAVQAESLGISHAVRFLGHREDVPDVLQESDLFVLPSRTEAFPNGVLEAMAAGLPVVASSVGGIPELIRDDENGVLVPVADEDALAAAILSLMREPHRLRERRSKRATRSIRWCVRSRRCTPTS
jgi:glycosyltransferase involved in cell wall biosynthesis